jgi:hypothetical protein
MPTTTNITTTYAGEFAGKIISASLLSANTLENGGMTIMPNVKFRSTMKRLSTDDLVKDATCDFDPTSTITLTERVLEPSELQINLSLCKSDYTSDWMALEMGMSAYDNLPKTFADYLIAYVGSKVAERTEIDLWQGVGSTSGQFDGITTLLNGATLPVSQDLTAVSIDASNVITELGRVADALPNSLYGKEDLKIYCPQNVIRAYVRALGGFASGIGANGLNNQGTTWYTGNANALTFDGIQLFMANGLPNNTIVATPTDNLFFATGVENDRNEVRLIDTAETLGDQNVRVIVRYTAGVNFGEEADVVYYH